MEILSSRLSAKDLKKSYGNFEALKGISFDIEQAGVCAILGQNGAGKTTLIKCALGLEKISAGRLFTMGLQPGKLAAKQQTGVILQDTDLPDTLTVIEHITLFASYYPNPIKVEEAIDLCDLSSFANKRYKQLSGGQKRRVQFALAIIGDPKLVFLDEPTTGLDIDARRNLWAVIRGFSEQGKTIVLTTHYLEEADNLADRIMILNAGKIVSDTSPQTLRSQARGTIIRFESIELGAAFEHLPHVIELKQDGRFTEIRSDNVNATLSKLLSLFPSVRNLSVNQPKLEDIYSELSKQGAKQ